MKNRIGVVGDKLFYEVGITNICCECIGQPYVSKIAQAIKSDQAELTRLREAIKNYVALADKITNDASHETHLAYFGAYQALEALAKHKEGDK